MITKSNRIIALLLLAVCLSATVSFGQKILVSKSGQKILVAKDGSWSIVQDNQHVDEFGNVKTNVNTSLDAFESPKTGKYPLTVTQTAELNALQKTYKSDEAQLLVNLSFFEDNLADSKSKLKVAKKQKDAESVSQFQSQIESTKEIIEQNRKAYKKSSKLVVLSQSMLAGQERNSAEILASMLSPKASDMVEDGMGGTIPDVAAKDTMKDDQPVEIKREVSVKLGKQYPTMFKVDKGRNGKGEIDCTIVHDGFDPDLGKKKKEVQKEFFFGFSQDRMKPYFKTDDYITCEASVSKVGKHFFLKMDIRVKSKDAKKSYGILRENEKIRLELIDGSKVYCNNILQDNGIIEAYTGHTLYTGIFQIDKDDLKRLKTNYLDNVGIVWSSGYEKYNIYNVDFLKNQLACLEK